MAEQPLESQPGDGDKPDAEVIPFKRDTSFEHPLDDAPGPVPVHDGDGIAIPRLGGERLPIVPEHLQTCQGIKSTAGKYLDAARFHALFHALRSPKYLALSGVWACAGVVKLARSQLRWWWVTEQSFLRSKAVVDGNSPEWRSLHTHVVKRRSFRGSVLAFEVFIVVLTLVLIGALAPWWAWLIVAAVTVPPFAHYGRPAHLPIVQSAVTTPLVRKISTDAIIRAYERAGLCSTDPKKPADHLGFGSTMTRDALDKGSQVVVYLPYGGTFAAVVNAKTKIASGLDVAESRPAPRHRSTATGPPGSGGFLAGLELVPPGVMEAKDWRGGCRDVPPAPLGPVHVLAGVARKRQSLTSDIIITPAMSPAKTRKDPEQDPERCLPA